MLNSFRVNLVAKGVLIRELAQFLELKPNSPQFRNIVIVLAPERHSVVLIPDRKYRSVDKLVRVFIEKSSYHVEDQRLPCLIAFFFHVFFYRQCHYPLSTLLVMRIFPLRPNSLFEEQVISIRYYFANPVRVVIHSPKIFQLHKY